MLYGGEQAAFTSFNAGAGFLNLIAEPEEREWSWWGRVIFYDSDVDALYDRLVAAGLCPQIPPRDASWGERFFHMTDPDGHELSFAWPLRDGLYQPANSEPQMSRIASVATYMISVPRPQPVWTAQEESKAWTVILTEVKHR